MARILAIDYGMKRTGIAVTDPLQIIASPLLTVETGQLMKFLEDYFRKEKVDAVIFGDPKNLDNTDSALSDVVRKFAAEVQKKFPEMKIEWVDERFTSKMAQQTIISSGLKKMDRRNKSLLDKVSAALILQHYLETKKR